MKTNLPIKNQETEEKAQRIAALIKANKVIEANDEFQDACLNMVRWEMLAFADRIRYLQVHLNQTTH